MNTISVDMLQQLANKAWALPPILQFSEPDYHWAPYYNFLALLAQAQEPEVIVELGVLHGVGTAYLATGYYAAMVIGIDTSLEALCPREKYPYKNNIVFLEGDPLKMIPHFHARGSGIGLLFIDSEHTYETTMKQYQVYKELMRPGGIILLDDIHLCGDMERVWQEIKEEKVELPQLHDSGFGAVIVCDP